MSLLHVTHSDWLYRSLNKKEASTLHTLYLFLEVRCNQNKFVYIVPVNYAIPYT